MNFFRIASKSKLAALVALAASGVFLGACDSTVEGGGSGGSGGGEEETSAVSVVGTSGVGGSEETSSVSSAAGGSGPGSSTSIALFASEIPSGGENTTVSVGSSGAGGADEGSAVAVGTGSGTGEGSVVAVGVGVGGSSGEGGAGPTGGNETSVVAVGTSGVGGSSGEGGYGTSDVGVGVGGSSGEGGYGSAQASVGTGSSGEGGYSSSSSGGGDPGWDPDRLFLFISDDIVECSDPYGVDDMCGPRQFRAQIGLPVAYQQVGTYSLNDPAIIASFSEWEGNANECMGGGGSFFDGTIEVLSIDDTAIRVRLSGTSPADVDGEHTVLRCGSAPPPGDSYSVLAYFPSDIPQHEEDENTSSVTVGGFPGEEDLIIDFADHDQVCSDPYADQPGPGQTFRSLSLHIPPSYLVPGTYSLSDPAITAIHTEMSESTGAVGGGPGIEPGTLTIFEVTESFIDLQLEGTQYDFANGGGQVPRCH